MGEVYLAEDTKLDRQVALKVLLAGVANDDERVRRFMQEAKAASALNHPNILTVFEIGSVDGSQYIATEFIKGKTLRDHMLVADLSVNEALGIALNVAAALGAAHEAGIIHRDIKPENIMVRDDGLVKVLDFGLAKLTEKYSETAAPEDATRAQLQTQPGLVMGTVAYMSPEQARGYALDARTDIFSLGIVMYEVFTGRRPFDGESQIDLVSSIIKDEPPGLRQLSPDLPRQLERIVDKTLRKDRDHRYQHVKDLQIDLEDLRDELKFEAKLNRTVDQPIPAHVTETDTGRPTLTESISATRRFTLLHAFIFIAAVLALVGAAWLLRANFGARRIDIANLKTTEIANWSSAPGELFSNASYSPDGKLIAFSSTKSGSKNIWVMQSESSEAIQVTNDAFSNMDPIWSPKGDEIAFKSLKGNSSAAGSNSTGVWRVSALGGSTKSVGAITDGSFELRRWAASGKIYYQSQGNLHSLDPISGVSQNVTSLDQQVGKVMWVSIAPDESSIAYIREKDDVWQLYTSDLGDSRPTKLAGGTGAIGGAVWLPDRKRFFISAMVDGIFQVFVIDDAGEPVRITSSETDSSVVDSAPDGRSIIVSSAKEESSIWRIRVSDGQESPVSRSVNSELWPAVSPDGERVAFQSSKNLNRGNNLFSSSILVKSLKSRDDRPTPVSDAGFLPTWSPDGSSVAFLRKTGGVIELFTANPNGGGQRRLTSGGIPDIGFSVSPYNHMQTRAFAYSPAGSEITYISERDGASNIWSVSAADGSDRILTKNADPDATYYCPIWSPDGKAIAFASEKITKEQGAKAARGIHVVNVETGATTSLTESGKISRLLGWTEDGTGLIVAESTKQFSGLPPETILTKISVTDGKETELTRLKSAYYYNIFLSDDRKYIAFAARAEDKDDLWLIPAVGGSPRKLTNNNDSGLYFSRLSWLHDGSTIVFGKQTRFSLLSTITGVN